MSHVRDMFYMKTEPVASGGGHFHIPVGDTFLHIQASSETVDIPYCQIQFLVNEAQADMAPVCCIGYAGMEMGITVFPPSYTGIVQKRNAGHEGTAVTVAAIRLFKVSPLSETTVSEAEYAFGHPQVIGVKTILNDVPFVGL
ncbi:hypothetical protein HMPREF9446_00166 [Bacteroides fluxus YIT 12057]|uniref:Uncharacterized protein n=1 Tax=Bacteroides fluxus YIT 12057 TaxID=763034 RepID=F3PN81_9BACE|nr:hypothetical protein HMPREF9446_00166 [Bacteroides fluxus YIT 12057]